MSIQRRGAGAGPVLGCLEREMAEVAAYVEGVVKVARRLAREAGITSDLALRSVRAGFHGLGTEFDRPRRATR